MRVFLAVTGAALLLVACASLPAYPQAQNEGTGKVPGQRRTFSISKFYDTPSPLPFAEPGDLIRSEEFEQYDLPLNVLAVRILYHSRSASGQDVAASGVVLYPDTKAPSGGWPVIAWAHALNGVARQCAPSLARNVGHGPFLAMYVDLGYAVVAADYAGLGTSFRNAFSDVQSNAADVIYSLPAARAAVPQLNSRWLAIGIREGGPAVVAVAEMENEIRGSNYLGSIAISGLDDLQFRYAGSGPHTLPEMPVFLAYGIKTVYPEFDVNDILTDRAVALYQRIAQACGDPSSESKLGPADVLKASWRSDSFVMKYFERKTLGQRPAKAPILVISSADDPAIPMHETEQVISRMCKQGDRVQFETYPESVSGRVFGDSVRDQIAWIQARFAGRPATTNCAERP